MRRAVRGRTVLKLGVNDVRSLYAASNVVISCSFTVDALSLTVWVPRCSLADAA